MEVGKKSVDVRALSRRLALVLMSWCAVWSSSSAVSPSSSCPREKMLLMHVYAALLSVARLLSLIIVGLCLVFACLSGRGPGSASHSGPPIAGLSVPVSLCVSPLARLLRGAFPVGRVWGGSSTRVQCTLLPRTSSHICCFFLRPFLLGGGVVGLSGSCWRCGASSASSLSMSVCIAASAWRRCCSCGITYAAGLLRLFAVCLAWSACIAALSLLLPRSTCSSC